MTKEQENDRLKKEVRSLEKELVRALSEKADAKYELDRHIRVGTFTKSSPARTEYVKMAMENSRLRKIAEFAEQAGYSVEYVENIIEELNSTKDLLMVAQHTIEVLSQKLNRGV